MAKVVDMLSNLLSSLSVFQIFNMYWHLTCVIDTKSISRGALCHFESGSCILLSESCRYLSSNWTVNQERGIMPVTNTGRCMY